MSRFTRERFQVGYIWIKSIEFGEKFEQGIGTPHLVVDAAGPKWTSKFLKEFLPKHKPNFQWLIEQTSFNPFVLMLQKTLGKG
ncbi:carboxy-lyase [Dorcoceras hygrometricum]|uniref:Carboxy-lyase n=1 Tax=Dorcoceras hygrometricum TaxID=472368 RepID=A0A2Z7BQN2_9LAMI|nr:carboxy-lyase [Dorcoceras hygrometricum]